jgi:cytoskeleton protein RodZ
MGQDDQQSLNAETDDWIFSTGISLGALFKKEREKKGLSHAQISRQTRVRPRFLEAIENEDWDLLPAPALVKGFIRSYARVLALDEERIVGLYGEEARTDDFPEKLVLPSIPQRKIWPIVVGGLLVFLVAVSGFYAWVTYSTDSKGGADTSTIVKQNSLENDTPTVVPDAQPKIDRLPPDEKGGPTKTDTELAEDISAVSLETQEKPDAPEISPPEPLVTQNTVGNEPKVETPPALKAAETFELLLKGHVTERTWVRISIDGLEPKEYTFGPSDKPEWKAEKNFELLIGNAGGIVLEFNGKKMDNLGKQGQVVRIKLPGDKERNTSKD